MAIAGLIGVYNAFFEYRQPALQFSTGSPRDAWHPNLAAKDAPDWAKDPLVCAREEFLRDFEIKSGLIRDIELCFAPEKSDADVVEDFAKQSQYDIASARKEGYTDNQIIDFIYLSSIATITFNDGSRHIYQNIPENVKIDQIVARAKKDFPKLRVADVQRAQRGDVIQNYISAPAYDGFAWWHHRVDNFMINPKMLALIERELPRIERERFVSHVREVLSIAAYFIGGFWLFSFVIGWIVRGFAGIPRGWDFRTGPTKAADQKMLGGLDDKAI